MKELDLYYELALLINQELYNEEKITQNLYNKIQKNIIKRQNNGSI